MKDIELKLISELMKNSRRSDRELAKVLGVSQPTVSRLIKKLEKDGTIKEYTMIPDFLRLGINLFVVTFVRHSKQLDSKELDEVAKMGIEHARQENSPETIMAERGIGLAYGSVILSYEKDYSSYSKLIARLRNFQHLDLSSIQSFLVDLNDPVHFRYLTFTTLAKYIRDSGSLK